MIKVIKAGIDADVAADMDAKVKATVETTLKDIETRGDAAVRELSEKFDNWSPESFRLSDEEIAAAVARWPEFADEAGVADGTLQNIAGAHRRLE